VLYRKRAGEKAMGRAMVGTARFRYSKRGCGMQLKACRLAFTNAWHGIQTDPPPTLSCLAFLPFFLRPAFSAVAIARWFIYRHARAWEWVPTFAGMTSISKGIPFPVTPAPGRGEG